MFPDVLVLAAAAAVSLVELISRFHVSCSNASDGDTHRQETDKGGSSRREKNA